MDRHFVEEISLYYSRCLLPKKNSCARIHIFRSLIGDRLLHDPGVLDDILARAAGGEWKEVNDELQDCYLGFVVVRPLPSVPIGRTVLVPPPELAGDPFFTTVSYTVHFLGFSIEVKGLAFQQQDRAVGACATTAVWTALQQSLKKEGGRPPTPSEITEAAVRFSVPGGRPLPSSGLVIEQICEALRAFAFAPDLFEVKDSPSYFKLRLILSSLEESPQISASANKLRLRNLDYDSLYIHDDRLGPYALARLVTTGSDLELRLQWPSGETEQLRVSLAAVPLYPKLRSSAHELFESAIDLFPIVRELFTGPDDELGVEFFSSAPGGIFRISTGCRPLPIGCHTSFGSSL
jgi:hypothetical protein